MDDGIVAIGDRPADIPISRFLNEPFSNFQKEEYSIGYVFNHRFLEGLSPGYPMFTTYLRSL